MRDVTDLMDRFRGVARSIWESGFSEAHELRNWDFCDQFDQVKNLLFRALVDARVVEGHFCDLITVPTHRYLVVPTGPGSVPIMIHRPREGDRNRYWDDPVNEVRASEAEFHFLDYFDWDQLSSVNFQYYRVHITAFPSQPHLVGREALIEHKDAKVFFDGDDGRT